MLQIIRRHFWLFLSVILNIMLFLALTQAWEKRSSIEAEARSLDQSVNNLYRVIPKDFYTRNEFALALALPGATPTIRDCLVIFGNDVFVFDRENTLIGVYPIGPNPFVVESEIGPNYKCNARLLDEQTRRGQEGLQKWEERVAPAKRLVQRALEADDPAWGKRGGMHD